MNKYNADKLKMDLKELVTDFRYKHCLMVAEEASKLAHVYHLDEDKAYVTGLLHDIAKDFSDEDNRDFILSHNLDKKLLNKKYQNIIHADIGAIYVKEKYDFDEEMCNAIKYHAIGNKKMDKFAKIIFVADKIGRENLSEDYKKIKEMTQQDLDKAIIIYIDILRDSLKKRGLEEQINTKELYDFISQKTD